MMREAVAGVLVGLLVFVAVGGVLMLLDRLQT